MRIALVNDFLLTRRGAERTFETLYEMFPSADIFTLLHNPNQINFGDKKIITSFIQKMPFVLQYYRYLYYLYPSAIETLDLHGYDIVISNSAMWAHGVITHPGTYHVAYCHTPYRYGWYLYPEIIKAIPERKFLKIIGRSAIFNYLRTWDYSASQKADCCVANSKNIQTKIKKYYHRKSQVIYPPVDIDSFPLSSQKGEYYLVISELVSYKRVDISIDAFIKSGKQLIIIGRGPEYKQLREKSRHHKNIKMLGWVTDEKKLELISQCKCVIVSAEEDFGIVSVEAQACGKPVIAFNAGGSQETVIEGKTGIFFDEQKSESLLEAVIEFEDMEFDSLQIKNEARRFDKKIFVENWKKLIKNI